MKPEPASYCGFTEGGDEKVGVASGAGRAWHGPWMVPWLYDQYAHLNRQRLALDMMWHEQEVVWCRQKLAREMRAGITSKKSGAGDHGEIDINEI